MCYGIYEEIMGKFKEPTVGLARNTPLEYRAVGLPADVLEGVRRGAIQDSINFRRKITEREFVIRAVIDRVGKVFGTRYAERLYRQYFNGIAPLRRNENELPEISVDDKI
jgi:hypothetical protein